MSVTAFVKFFAKTSKNKWVKISEATSNIIRDLIRWEDVSSVSKPTDFDMNFATKYKHIEFYICKDDYKKEFGEIVHLGEFGRDCILVKDEKLLEEIRKVQAPSSTVSLLLQESPHFIFIVTEKTAVHKGDFYNEESFIGPLRVVKDRIKKNKKHLRKLKKFELSKDYYSLSESQKEDFCSDMNDTQSCIEEDKVLRDNIVATINVFNYFNYFADIPDGWAEEVIAYIYVE